MSENPNAKAEAVEAPGGPPRKSIRLVFKNPNRFDVVRPDGTRTPYEGAADRASEAGGQMLGDMGHGK